MSRRHSSGKEVEITYDESVDSAYVRFASGTERTVFGFTYSCAANEVGGIINLDFDIDGRIIGMEILDASKILPVNFLESEKQA